MQESKMIELANELLRNARAGKLDWEEDSEDDGFTIDFPDVSLSIVNQGDSIFTLQLINDEGDVIEEISASQVHPTGKTLQEIYDLAKRQVWNIDGNIDKALGYLRRR